MSVETKPENPPAFPTMERFEQFDEDRGKYVEHHLPEGGMTLRDYFAAKAMQAYIAKLLVGGEGDFSDVAPSFIRSTEARSKEVRAMVAAVSFKYADAMLAERSKP